MDTPDYEYCLYKAKEKAASEVYKTFQHLGGTKIIRNLKKEIIELRQLRASSSDEDRRKILLYLILCGECQIASIQDLAQEELLKILEEEYGIEMLNWYLEKDNDENI